MSAGGLLEPREQPAAPSVPRMDIIYSPWTVDLLVHSKVLSFLLAAPPITGAVCASTCVSLGERRNQSQGCRGGTKKDGEKVHD